jgi:translation elongation factor aEF-1 beta
VQKLQNSNVQTAAKLQYGDVTGAANSADHINAQSAVSKGRKGEQQMAKMLVSMKIFPEDVTIPLDQIKQKIEATMPADSEVLRFGEEPIAYGLTALIAHILVPEDKQDELEKIEASIRQIPGVSNIETFMMQRW